MSLDYIQKIIHVMEKYSIGIAPYVSVFQRLMESHRYYHTPVHVYEMMDFIDNDYFMDIRKKRKYILAALYHDCVYDPAKTDNEEESVKVMTEDLTSIANTQPIYLDSIDIPSIAKMIMDTKNMSEDTEFTDIDRYFLHHGSLERLVEDGCKIREEYLAVPYDKYVEERCKFLEQFVTYNPNIIRYISLLSRRDSL